MLAGVTTVVKVAHVRLCNSRMPFVRAYPREAQEMVFDAHNRAFAFFKGAAKIGIYDNMKTAVDGIFVGKERAYNRRFLAMCSHHFVDRRPIRTHLKPAPAPSLPALRCAARPQSWRSVFTT